MSATSSSPQQMKKEKKYFMVKIACGMLRIKLDNTIEKPKTSVGGIEDKKLPSRKRTTSTEHVSYGEMIPDITKKESLPKKTPRAQKGGNSVKTEDGDAPVRDKGQGSCSLSSTDQIVSSASVAYGSSLANIEVTSSTDGKGFAAMCFQNKVNALSCESKDGERSPSSNCDSGSFDDEQEKQLCLSKTGPLSELYQDNDELEYSVCSVCQNKRPNIELTKEFSYSELYQATNGFSSDNFLSEGGFGSVYKGELKCGLKVAVKQHKDVSSQGEKEFKSEVNVLSKARHQNLVMLLGSCSEGTHRLLVYEFVCNGSLDQHLSRHAEKPLTWANRIKIALGAAKGLEYLHNIKIIHRDMRPNNILVTHDYEALLGDFGLARTQSGDSDETSLVGTLGYVAPEYAECGKVSTKTDVYSFGVVLLQLITGCMRTEEKFEGKSLVEWARPLLEEKNYPGLIDERIVDSHDVHQLLLMVWLVERCLNKDPAKRDTMGNVVTELEYIMKSE